MIERQAVRSRDIAVVGYDPDQAVLEITFRQGGVYQYAGVPLEIHRDLIGAASHGTYFNRNIKEKYSCIKLR